MRCPRCHDPMVLLFYSAVCDRCEGPPRGTFYRGYVVWREPDGERAHSEHVFRTAHDAAIWRSLTGLDDGEVRSVLSEHPIAWRVASGRAAGLVWADGLYDVYRDHRHERGPYRAFLAPASLVAPRECVQLNS
jgi:hypothetical protein